MSRDRRQPEVGTLRGRLQEGARRRQTIKFTESRKYDPVGESFHPYTVSIIFHPGIIFSILYSNRLMCRRKQRGGSMCSTFRWTTVCQDIAINASVHVIPVLSVSSVRPSQCLSDVHCESVTHRHSSAGSRCRLSHSGVPVIQALLAPDSPTT